MHYQQRKLWRNVRNDNNCYHILSWLHARVAVYVCVCVCMAVCVYVCARVQLLGEICTLLWHKFIDETTGQKWFVAVLIVVLGPQVAS